MPFVTVKIAFIGHVMSDGTTSRAGHMWFSLDDGSGAPPTSWGYNSGLNPPEVIGPGRVSNDDDNEYGTPNYQVMLPISASQLSNIQDFVIAAENGDFGPYNGLTNSCVDFTWEALAQAGIMPSGFFNQEGAPMPGNNEHILESTYYEYLRRQEFNRELRSSRPAVGVNITYLLARGWRPPRGDPLALDLDNDGIETVGISAGILFDHNADGIKTGTGWLKPDDGFLVLDRNGNGTIDSGRELFGVDTVLSNGLYASDGFTALADLDTNADHVFNSSDAQFANVRVWRDLNQDGVSQAGELSTLSSLGITAIDLNAHTATKTLAGGNTQTLIADVAGLEGPAANINLDQNPFYSQFTDSIPLTPQTQPLPDMQGAGAVRSLREAATLSPALATKLATLQSGYLTRDQLMAQLGSVLTLWANTSSLASSVDWGPGYYMSKEQVCLGMATINVTTMMTPADRAIQAAQDVKRPQLLNEISVLERFNGLTFITRNPDGTIILGNGNNDPMIANPMGGGGDTGLPAFVSVPIILPDPQVALIDQAYQALVDSVYDALALQTRLKGYVDSIGLTIDDTGMTMDYAALHAANDWGWRRAA